MIILIKVFMAIVGLLLALVSYQSGRELKRTGQFAIGQYIISGVLIASLVIGLFSF